jgi:hypothetical protein
MKKALILLLLFFCIKSIRAQSISGSWEGLFTSDVSKYETKRFHLKLEIIQDGRNIDGFFSTSPMGFPDSLEVVYKVSGKLNKNNSAAFFRLINGGIVKTLIPYGKANVFLEFECNFETKDSIDYLKGRWFPNGIPSRRNDGAAGDFKVKRVSSTQGILHKQFATSK